MILITASWTMSQTSVHSSSGTLSIISNPLNLLVTPLYDLCQQTSTSQSYGFSSSHVWLWELDYKESWAPKNWCFWTVVLEKTLESPLGCKEIKPVNAKEISPEYSLDGEMLKLKLQYFGHLIQRADSLEKTLMLGKTEAGEEGNDRGWDGWMASLTQWAWIWATQGLVMDREVCHAADHGVAKSHTQLSDWTKLYNHKGFDLGHTWMV